MSTDIGSRFPVNTIDNTSAAKKINNPATPNNATQPLPQQPAKNTGNQALNNSVNLTDNITKSATSPQVIEFTNPSPVLAAARDIDIKVEDIDGIDTNSKNDLKASITGNITFSKQGISDSLEKLEKMLNDKYPDVNIKLEANPSTNEYVVSINKGVRLGGITLRMEDGGINTKIELSGWTKGVGYAISPLAMLAFNPEKMITDYVQNTLTKDLGMTTTSTGKNQFKLVPDFKNNHLQDLPVGNMKLHLENITASNSNFKLDPSGNLVMDLNVQATASSNKYAAQAVDEGSHDLVSGKVNATYHVDGSAETELKDGRLQLDIKPEEAAGLGKQLEGFGQKGINASGTVTVSDVNTKTYILPDKKIVTEGVSTANIEANNLKFDQGNNHVDLKSTTGQINYKQQDNGGFSVGVKGGVNGSLAAQGSSININSLNIDGNVSYNPAVNGNPASYKIESDKISAKAININNQVAVTNVNINNASMDVNAATGDISISSKPGNKATISSIKAGNDLNLNKVSFSGNIKAEPKSGKITVESRSLSFTGKVAGNDINLSSARGANFSGKMVYDPATGISVSGNNGKKNASVSNLTGNINGFKVDGLTADGGFKIDNAGNLNMVNAGKFRLNAEGVQVSGNNLRLSQHGDVISTYSGHNKVNLSFPQKGAPAKKVVSNLVVDGNINYNTKTNAVSFNNDSSPLKIRSGSIADVHFNNFQPSGAVELSNNNQTIAIKGPSSFTGEATFNDLSVKNFKSDQTILFDNSQPKKQIVLAGNAEAEVKLPGNKEFMKIATSGDIKINQDGNKFVLTSNNGSVSGKFGDIELDNMKFQGKVTFDTKTQEMKLEKLDPNTDISFNGKLNGSDLNVKSPSGSVSMKKEGENYVVSADDVKLAGNVGEINFTAGDKGINGKVVIPPNGKPFVKDLDLEMEVEGVKFTTKGGSVNKSDGGYEINLSGGIQADNGKVAKLLDKIIDSPYASNPDTKKQLTDLKQTLSKIDLTKLKYEDFKISFDKNMNYNMSITATELAMDIPERMLKVNNLPPGKITVNMDSSNKVSISSTQGTNINASIGGTQFQDFNIKGSINYTPASEGKPEKVTFSKNNLNINQLEISGNIKYENEIKKLKFHANADVDMVKNGSNLEFQGSNMNIDGMFDGFNVKSLPTENAGTADPTFASGKVIVKENGRIDLSDLKFKMLVDGVQVTNNGGGVTASEKGYEIKLSGDVSTNINTFTSFLKKLSTNNTVPDSAKEAIRRTIMDLQNYVVKGDIKEAKYKDMILNMDPEFNIKSFSLETSATVTNAKVKLDLGGSNNTLNFDKIDIEATSQSAENKNLFIKNGKVHFELTDNFKASMSDSVKNIISQNSGISLEKMKDLKVDMSPDGTVSLSGKINFKSIVNVNLGVTMDLEGTKVNVSIDKTRLGGFLGLVQSVVQPVTGKAEQIVTDKLVDNMAQNVKVEYTGKQNVFSVDLQNIFSKYVNDNAKIKDINISNNQVNLNYEVTYGSERKYNLSTVEHSVESLNSVAYPQGKKVDATVVTNGIVGLSAHDLSAVFNRTSIVPQLVKRLGEKNYVAIMNKLADNINIGNNSEHLRQFINEKEVSKKALQFFLKNLSREEYQSLPPEVSDALKQRLVNK